MSRIYYSIILMIGLLPVHRLNAQLCDPITPTFTVNLSGNPSGTWVSPSVTREGHCCSATSPDVCIQFIITLDPTATGINFNIASGAIPPGALYYQINCGPEVMVGQPICLNGAGPHILTFCKPGNNQNTYAIASFAPPVLSASVSNTVSPQCNATIFAEGVVPSSVTWSSVPPNALYNSYLSCLSGCDSASVTATGIFPPYIDYRVCGTGAGACDSGLVCDTVRVYFYPDVTVTVSPGNTTLCNGTTATMLTATAGGGSGSYQYVWSNGLTTSNINVGAGTYSVTVSDTAVCAPASAGSTITILPPITANAGIDVTVCAYLPAVSLSGSVQTATGGIWSGGTGTYNPNNSALNAVYTPSATEIANGYANLILETTSNQGCPPGYDTIHVTIVQPPSASISGNTIACANSTTNYSVPVIPGCSYSWSAAGGAINGSSISNSINVTWGNTGSGTVTLTLTNSAGCTTTINQTISLVVLPNPVITGNDLPCQFTIGIYSVNSFSGSTYLWTVTNGSITSGNGTPSIQVNWNTFGSGSITVTETNSFGCTQSNTFPVTVNQPPVASIAGDITGCFSTLTTTYTSPAQSSTTYSWSVTGGVINGSSTSNSANITWGITGSGTVTVTVTSSTGCTATASQNVTLGLIPNPVISGNNSTCQFTPGNYSVNSTSGSIYNWTVSNGTITSGNGTPNILVNWNTFGSGSVTVTETNSFGCTQSTTYPVTINQPPVASIAGDITGCFSTLTAIYTSPAQSNTTYSWSVTGGVINGSSTSNSANITWGITGSGTVTVTVTSSAGCTATASQNVTLGLIPNPVISGNNSTCQFTPGNYSVNSTSGSIYNWTVSNGTITSGNGTPNILVSWNTFGSGSVTVTETNSFGCTQSTTFPVTINQQPVASVTGDITGCLSSLTMNYTSPVQSNVTYAWSVNGGIINGSTTSNSANVTWANGTGTVTVTITNSSGCTATSTQNVSVGLLPNPAINGNNSTCQFTPGNYSVNPSPGSTYSWTINNGTISGSSNNSSVVVDWNTYGSGTVTVTETNSYGCTESAVFPVNVYQQPAASIAGDVSGCVSSLTTTYTTPVQSNATYSWSVNGGVINGSSGSNSVNVTWGNPVSGSVSVSITNNYGCIATATESVTLILQPNPMITGNSSSCQFSTENYSLTPTPGSTYSWYATNGMIVSGNGSPSVQVNWNTFGSGIVTVTETNNQGCTQSNIFSVNIFEQPIPAISGNATACTGSSALTYSAPAQSNTNYSWLISGGTITSGNGSNTVSVVWYAQGSNYLSLTVSNSSGCDSTVIFPVETGAVNPVSVMASGLNGCPPLTVTIYGNTPAAGQTYSWSFGDQDTSAAPNPVHVYTQPGVYPVHVLTQHTTGCMDSSTAMVHVYELPRASFQHNFEYAAYIIGESELSVTNTSQGASTYSWSFGGNGSSGEFEPEHLYVDEGEYEIFLITMSSEGCLDTAVSKILVKSPESIYVPNAFTPNGDHSNDFFSMLSINIVKAQVSIFNRWGTVIYSSEDVDFKWDGTFSGRPVEMGVYVYRIVAEGESGIPLTLIGTVSVVR